MAPYKSAERTTAISTADDHETNLQLKDMRLFNFGAFSNVYRGVCESPSLTSQKEVVVKKTWIRKKASTISEVVILKTLGRLKHKNIVRLLYFYSKDYEGENSCLSLVFEFMSMNLYQYLKMYNRKLPLIEIKMFTWQLFRGQYHLLRISIAHRDIKPQNLLVNADTGVLKISDFGSSTVSPRSALQPSYHVTRYYRPPELLLGAKSYGCEVDIWSIACVFGEMLRCGILFPGHTTANQVGLIFDAIGKPTNEERKAMEISSRKWQELGEGYKPLNGNSSPSSNLKAQMPSDVPSEAVSILTQMLVYKPNSRLHGVDLLTHKFFMQLFSSDPGTRANGKPVNCLSKKDMREVKNGDASFTGTTQSAEAIPEESKQSKQRKKDRDKG